MRRVDNLIPGIGRCQKGVIGLASSWLLNDMVSFAVITGNERTVKSSSDYTYRSFLQMKCMYTHVDLILNKLMDAYWVVSVYTVSYRVLSVGSLFTIIRSMKCLLDPLDLMLLLPETFFKFSFYQLSLMAPHVNLMKPLQQ